MNVEILNYAVFCPTIFRLQSGHSYSVTVFKMQIILYLAYEHSPYLLQFSVFPLPFLRLQFSQHRNDLHEPNVFIMPSYPLFIFDDINVFRILYLFT